MAENKHTEGKWSTNLPSSAVKSENGTIICDLLHCNDDDGETMAANAEYIVYCVNHFDEVAKAAKIGLGALEILSTFLKDAKLEANNLSIDIVKKALKNAQQK